jgi:hypothetical protein
MASVEQTANPQNPSQEPQEKLFRLSLESSNVKALMSDFFRLEMIMNVCEAPWMIIHQWLAVMDNA